MPTPSLLLVPARFKTGRLYSQIPTNTYNRGDFTVTRNTAARRFNSAGLIESVASGIPRLDYYTSGGVTGCPALLVEPAGTNLCLQSEDFSTTWSPTNTVVSGNVAGTTDPTGGNTADQIFETAASGLHFLAQTMTIVSGTTYVGSVFYKKAAGSPDWMQVAFSTTGLAGFANFNLTSGTVGLTGAGCTGRIENYGNGWYRCTLIQTANANGTSGGPIIVFTNNTNSVTRFVGYVGNTATSIYAWGAQLETGSVATSYIPTTAGTGSRSADFITVTGAVSGSIGQQSGTVYCEFQFGNTITNNAGVFSVESTNNLNRVLLANFSPTTCVVQVQANGSPIFTTSIGTLTVGQYYKIAVGYSSGNTKVYLNGNSTPVITNTSGYTMAAALSRICLGNYENSSLLTTNSRIRSLALYAERLTDAEMIALTTP